MAFTKVRVDKWLWAVRIYKSRTLSGKHCKGGKVKVNDRVIKASSFVAIGDIVKCQKNGFNLTFKVEKLIEKRVNATLAAECYTDLTPPDELNKFKDWYVGKQLGEHREKGLGRPTKKERREIEQYKEQAFEWDMWDDDEDL